MLRPPADVGVGADLLNADRVLLADWVELSALLHEPDVVGADLVDQLLEDEQAEDDDQAWQVVGDIWTELRRRRRSHALGTLSVVQGPGRYELTSDAHWREAPAHVFALWCSLRLQYPAVQKEFQHDYAQQGALWEKVVHAGLEVHWPDWTVIRVGWAPDNPQKLLETATEVAAALGDRRHTEEAIQYWTPENAKDAGLDLVLHLTFADGHCGPRYFSQSASGHNWLNKTGTPDLTLWDKVIDWSIRPNLMMTIPFVIPPSDFSRLTWASKGLLLDRHRVLPDLREDEWLPDSLRGELVAYLGPRIDRLLVGATSTDVE